MREMVAGFLFCRFPMGHDHVLLVRKGGESWRRIGFPDGLWNGIGGKIDGLEFPSEAMSREFREETGLVKIDWHNFASETNPAEYRVHFFRGRIEWSQEMVDRTHWAVNDARELLQWHMTQSLPDLEVVGNLRWLIPLARDWRTFHADMKTQAGEINNIVRRPTW